MAKGGAGRPRLDRSRVAEHRRAGHKGRHFDAATLNRAGFCLCAAFRDTKLTALAH
jgi:hypothetical protein